MVGMKVCASPTEWQCSACGHLNPASACRCQQCGKELGSPRGIVAPLLKGGFL